MSNYIDSYGRQRIGPPLRQRTAARRRQDVPTLDDYQELTRAFQELQVLCEEQQNQVAEMSRELGIKDEALHRQNADLKNLETELVWTRAALEKADQDLADREPDEDWKDRYTRLQAELANMRKRWEQRFATETTEARHQILLDMLPLADHLELALEHAGNMGDDAAIVDFVRNIEATKRAFLDTLKRYTVEPIEAMGEPFDPSQHEAVGEVVLNDVPEGVVAQVTQTGYTEGERLLRPARVLVNRVDEGIG